MAGMISIRESSYRMRPSGNKMKFKDTSVDSLLMLCYTT